LWEKLNTASPGFRHYQWKVAVATQQLGEFYQATSRGKEAGMEYQKALKIWEDLTAQYPTVPAYPRQLAWFLACGPVFELRDPARAATLAGKATELAPTDGYNWATLAAARYRTGNWTEAQEAVEKAMTRRPWGEGLDWFLLAMIRWRLGDKPGARQWYDKAVEWPAKNDSYNPELRRLQAEAAELMGLPVPPTPKLALPAGSITTAEQPSVQDLLDSAPPSVQDLLDSARPFAEARDWKQAAAELNRGGESQWSDLFLCYSTALARLLADDVEGYARVAAVMPVAASSERSRWSRLDVLRTCTMHPRGVVDPAPLVPLAQSVYDEEANNWNAQILGMAHYRAGDFDKALRRFEEALKLTDWFLFWPAYAMCHHQLGHANEARQWLDKSNELFRHVTETDREPLKVTKEPFWQDWAYFEVMRQEANALIGGGK
jgi:tetratricopeptide (TPR) repeat protein